LITSVAYNDSTFSTYQDPLGGPSIVGNKLPFVSPVTAHGELTYSTLLPRSLGTLTARTGVDFFGKIFFDPQNTVYQAGYTLLNAGITWAKSDEFSLTIYGENLTNKNYAVYGFTMPAMGSFYQVGLGRTVGLRFQASL
jgi:outer membrane receptor protein involved in Fe transport